MARRSAADAAVTRADILAAARRLFAEQGYAATTTGQIAEAASVTVGALFHHFEGKPGLFRTVFEQIDAELDASIREAADEAGGAAMGIEAFLAGFRAYLKFAGRREFYRIMMREGPVVLGEDEWHALEAHRGSAALVEGLEVLVAEGVLEDRPIRPLAILLLGSTVQAGFEAARGAGPADLDALVEAMRYLLTPHLRGGAPSPQTAPAPVKKGRR